jgi:histidinol-phosphate aminotransferase
VDVEAVERAVRATASSASIPKLLFVSNPNNPDGSVTPRADLLRLLDLPLVVVVDEAYIDFSAEESLGPLVRERANLVVLRTFSKLAGMAGLRVGYGLFPAGIITHLWKMKQPYTPNVAGTLAALAAMADRQWLAETMGRIVAERGRLSAALQAFEWLRPLPSHTNFVLCRVGGGHAARAVKNGLERHSVLVRYFDKDGLRDCIRISVGRPEDTDALVRALRQIEGASS